MITKFNKPGIVEFKYAVSDDEVSVSFDLALLFSNYRSCFGEWPIEIENDSFNAELRINGCKHSVDVKTDKNGPYIEYNDLKINLWDFEAMSVSELADMQMCGKYTLHPNDVLATMLKHTDDFGCVLTLTSLDTAYANMIGMSREQGKVIAVPTTSKYDKYDWAYKITLEAKSILTRPIYKPVTMYFTDFVESLNNLEIKVFSFSERAMRTNDLIELHVPSVT